MVWIALQAMFCHIALLKTEPTLLLLLLFFVFVALLSVAVKVAEPSVADINAVLFIYTAIAVLFSPFTADVVLVAFFAIYCWGGDEAMADTHTKGDWVEATADPPTRRRIRGL
jgi:ABC-type arginine transport system permease subunit